MRGGVNYPLLQAQRLDLNFFCAVRVALVWLAGWRMMTGVACVRAVDAKRKNKKKGKTFLSFFV